MLLHVFPLSTDSLALQTPDLQHPQAQQKKSTLPIPSTPLSPTHIIIIIIAPAPLSAPLSAHLPLYTSLKKEIKRRRTDGWMKRLQHSTALITLYIQTNPISSILSYAVLLSCPVLSTRRRTCARSLRSLVISRRAKSPPVDRIIWKSPHGSHIQTAAGRQAGHA
jgi:hypothetical protein